MRIYLDTSTIRRNSSILNKYNSKEIFTSVLTIFELISGMNEKDFLVRQGVIKKLLSSSIHIDWATYKKKMHDAFEQPIDDLEGKVIKQMAEQIVECNSFEEYKKIKIYISNDTYYTYESFIDFDKEIAETGKLFSEIGQSEWRNISKENRKNIKKDMTLKDNLLPYIRILSELSLINLAEGISGCNRPEEKYLEVMCKYNRSLEVYLKYLHLLMLIIEMDGSMCSKNDTMDMLHLIYLKEGDIFVSEDKVFKRLYDYLKLVQIYNSDELILLNKK